MAKISCVNPAIVVKRAFFLAWQACGGAVGMGWLQNRPKSTEDDVWNNVQNNGDYPGGNTLNPQKSGKAYGDYVFGRMMKLSLHYNNEEGTVSFTDDQPRPDYQAWCRKYKTYKDLVEAAIASLK